MDSILLNISNVLIISFFIFYILMIYFYKNKKVTLSNGFNAVKDIISDYDSINIVLSDSYFTVYNIKRKVLKLSKLCYYGNGVSLVSLGLLEAGILIVDKNKNKFIEIFRRIFSNLKLIYLFSIVALFVSNSVYTCSNAKIGIFLILFISLFNYIYMSIKLCGCSWVSDNIVKVNDISLENKKVIISYMYKFIYLDYIILISEGLMIIRLLLKIINI